MSLDLAAELLHWCAYRALHEQLLSTDCRYSSPFDLYGPLCAYGPIKAACLLHAHYLGDSPAESYAIASRLMAMARDGKRPMNGPELGLTIEDFTR